MASTPSRIKRVVIGVDEAGRGCAWGSVFAGAVVLPDRLRNEEVMSENEKFLLRDSKKLSAKRREEARVLVTEQSLSSAVGECTAEEIDRMNILNATFTAMHRAIRNCIHKLNERTDEDKRTGLPIRYEVTDILVDGNRFRVYLDDDGVPIDHQCVIGGDASDRSIAAASILAKTSRDNHVMDHVTLDPSLDEKWGMSKHKGYCTKHHQEALREYGAHRLHRKSYAPVRAVLT
jgi:ribonuclease HII